MPKRADPEPHPAAAISDVVNTAADTLDPVVIRNRARLAALHQLRAPEPVDVNDAFLGWSWLVFVWVAVGYATRVLIDLDIAWAALAGFAVNFLLISGFLSVLASRENEMMRECERGVVDAPPPPKFDWRVVTPPHILRRVRVHLNDLNIDDDDLEDALDLLVRHGCDSYDLRPSDQRLGQ